MTDLSARIQLCGRFTVEPGGRERLALPREELGVAPGPAVQELLARLLRCGSHGNSLW